MLLLVTPWFVFNCQSIALIAPRVLIAQSSSASTVCVRSLSTPPVFQVFLANPSTRFRWASYNTHTYSPTTLSRKEGDRSGPLPPRDGTKRVTYCLLSDHGKAEVLLLPLPSPDLLPKYCCLFFRSTWEAETTSYTKESSNQGARAPVAFPHPGQ